MPAKLGMMATSLAPPRTKAEKKDEHFKLKDGMVEFGSSQLVEVLAGCFFLVNNASFFGVDRPIYLVHRRAYIPWYY